MNHESELRARMVEIGRRMYERDYIAGPAGNLSVRLGEDRFLTTPSGLHKAYLAPEQLLVVDLSGRVLEGAPGLRPTSELPMHLEVYRQRADVGAVIHAHPITCVALSLVGHNLTEPLIPEAVVLLGPVPTAPYATPSSEENRRAIAGLIANHQAIILAHHGVLTVGRTLDEAFDRLETLEHVARTVALAWQIGTPQPLSASAVEKLNAQRRAMGLEPPDR